MSFKLNANAPIFVPSTTVPTNNNNADAQKIWIEICCLYESIKCINNKMRKHNDSLQTKQQELKSYFTLFHSYNSNTLDAIKNIQKDIKSLKTMHDSLLIHLTKIEHPFYWNYPNYIHQYMPPQMLPNEQQKNPSKQHDLLIFGYIRTNFVGKMAVDIINLIKSLITYFGENKFIWKLKDILNDEKPIKSDIFYCNDIEFMLSLKECGLHLNIKPFGYNISYIWISYELYDKNKDRKYQNTRIFLFNKSSFEYIVYIGYKKPLQQMTINCNVSILSIGYNDGLIKYNDIKMRRNFMYKWEMNDLLTRQIIEEWINGEWDTNRFDNNNWCLSVCKFHALYFKMGLKLLQIPYNVSKIGVKYTIKTKHNEEHCIEYFSYDKPMHSWSIVGDIFALKHFKVTISVQILTAFDVNHQYIPDLAKFGVL